MAELWSSYGDGYYGNENLSRKLRLVAARKTKLLEAAEPSTEFNIGKKSGDKVAYRLVGEISTLATTPLNELQKIPMDTPPIYEGYAQIYRRGLGIPWTGVLEDLDRLGIEDQNIQVLQRHASKTHNSVIYSALVSGRSFTYVATGADTDAFLATGSVAATAAAGFSLRHAQKLAYYADSYNIPPADGENYLFYCSPKIKYGLLRDGDAAGFVPTAKYANGGAEGIINGEIGMVAGMRVIVDNHIIADSIGSGSAYGSGFVLGAVALKEVMGPYPLHLRANMNLGGDFGFQKAICWVSHQGYKVPWNYTAHGQGTVIHYTSA